MMKILAHRGHWRAAADKNTLAAFELAWSGGYGIETDLRDLDGTIMVSHDPPERGALAFEDLLQAYAKRGRQTPLALNIKADGLQKAVAQCLENYGVTEFFVFDMSIPDSFSYLNAGMPVYLRLSEYEDWTALHNKAAGIWLDAFSDTWWSLEDVRGLRQRDKSVAIISPELHGRRHEDLWRALRALEPDCKAGLLLCTDFPDDADRFFAT